MEEVCSDQTSLWTDCCCLAAWGQGRGISLVPTKSLFIVDSTRGSFPDQGSGLSHYSPAEEIMTCRCSAVGMKLVFLFCFFYFLLLYSKAAVVSSSVPPPAPQSRLPHRSPLPCYITGNVCCFLIGTYELFLTFILSLHAPLLFWRNLVIAIVPVFCCSGAIVLHISSSEGGRCFHGF